jgi:hypothetical protein
MTVCGKKLKRRVQVLLPKEGAVCNCIAHIRANDSIAAFFAVTFDLLIPFGEDDEVRACASFRSKREDTWA